MAKLKVLWPYILNVVVMTLGGIACVANLRSMPWLAAAISVAMAAFCAFRLRGQNTHTFWEHASALETGGFWGFFAGLTIYGKMAMNAENLFLLAFFLFVAGLPFFFTCFVNIFLYQE